MCRADITVHLRPHCVEADCSLFDARDDVCRPAICHLVKYSVIFSHQAPPSEDFVLTTSGTFILKRILNYNVVPKYEFIVTAEVSDTDRLLQSPAAV